MGAAFGRGATPKDLELPGFLPWLSKEQRAVGKSTQEDMQRGAARLFHMLRIDGVDLGDPAQASDPLVLASLYVNEGYLELLSHPVLNPEITWTRKFLEAPRDTRQGAWGGGRRRSSARPLCVSWAHCERGRIEARCAGQCDAGRCCSRGCPRARGW